VANRAKEPSQEVSTEREPIAIVGIGCRFPGGVHDPASFWEAVAGGTDAITDIPADRFDAAAWYHSVPGTPGRIASRKGGFVGAVEEFDAFLFGISPREAERLDPQQRLLLEVTWSAFEDAALDPFRHSEGLSCGVFVGQWTHDFESRLFLDPSRLDFHAVQGTGRYASSGRLSYVFGLVGPSLTIDTACSSSLTALYTAVQSLRAGEAPLALVGAVNVILQPEITIAYSQGGMMAPDGHSKFGDVRANGYVRSEGAAALVLKPLRAALADGDRIYSVIRGGTINNDGRRSGIFGRPSRAGQAALLQAAYANAGVPPQAVQYIEAHGTGTPTGDPVELGAIADVLGAGRTTPLLVGSVKTNFGHTESAAGLAGVIKVSLALAKGVIPPSLHLTEPTPAFPWSETSLRIPTTLVPWPAPDRERIAGVSAFGISGTNAHLVLSAAPPPPVPTPRPGALILPLGAHLPEALGTFAAAVDERLATAGSEEAALLAAAASRRPALQHRAVVVAEGVDALRRGVRAVAAGEDLAGVLRGEASAPTTRSLAFVFPGQGGQWVGMGRELLEREPAFACAIDRIEQALSGLVDWSLREQLALAADDPRWRLGSIEVIQPVLVAVEMAYAELLESYGVVANAAVGHSMGEVAAAWYAGALSLGDAMRVIVERSRLLGTVAGRGAMAVVELAPDEARAAIGTRSDRVSVAVQNARHSSVLSGDPAAVDEITAELEARGVYTQRVKVDVASHSPQMDPLIEPLRRGVGGIAPGPTRRTLYSTVEAAPIAGERLDPVYWSRNLREPVRFGETIERMLAEGFDGFIELGPHPVLVHAIGQAIAAAERPAITLGTGRRDESGQAGLLEALGRLHVEGHPIDWERIYPPPAPHDIGLPPLPMVRQRHWPEPVGRSPASSARMVRGHRAHPLLESPFTPRNGLRIWEWLLDLGRFGWLGDHVVRGSALLPAALMCEGFLAAAEERFGTQRWSLRDVTFGKAVPLTSDRSTVLQWSLHGDAAGCGLELSVRDADEDASWQPIAAARAVPLSGASTERTEPEHNVDSGDGAKPVYDRLHATGLEYGPAFQAITACRVEGRTAISTIRQPESGSGAGAGYQVPPVLLDAALQTLVLAAIGSESDGATALPTGIDRLDILALPDPAGVFTARATLGAHDDRGFAGDVELIAADGTPVIIARGARFAWVAAPRDGRLDRAFLELDWIPADLSSSPAQSSARFLLVASDGSATELARALAERGGNVTVVERGDALTRALAAESAPPALIWLGPPAAPLSDDLAERCWQSAVEAAAFCRTGAEQAERIAKVWIVTRNAVAVRPGDSVDPAQSVWWGLGRVLAHEHLALAPTLVDLDRDTDWAAVAGVLVSGSSELHLGRRGPQWYTARIVPADWSRDTTRAVPSAAESFAAELESPGAPEGPRWEARHRRAPAAGEVEIEVAAAGLGAPDGGEALGTGGVGTVVRVGAGVAADLVGTRVVFVASKAMARHVVTPAELAVPAPASLDDDACAGLPIAYLTASHALEHLARLERGERVLIHWAAGDTGLAAAAVAQHLGAEIFATADTEAKQAHLRALGVRHVFDSRTLDWVDGVGDATGGTGVDVVFNSLTGEAQAQGIGLLRPYGRFVEVGERDHHRVDLASFGSNNLSFFAVDLGRMIRERPRALGHRLAQVMARVAKGELPPLPTTVFEADRLAEAFHALASDTSAVVSLQPAPRKVERALDQAPVRADGTYLITGGLGGLGLEVARWLGRRGAGALVLVGRSEVQPPVRAILDQIEAAGTRVTVEKADVTKAPELAAVLERARAGGPPLRGVFHLAGVLDDVPLTGLAPERLALPFRPKVIGAVNLLRLTESDPLDYLTAFSSVASLFGTPGQGNYAAANAVLDALAAHPSRPFVSINWGPIARVGLATAGPRLDSLASSGFEPLEPADVTAALDRILGAGVRQMACAAFQSRQWTERMATAGDRALVSELLPAGSTPTSEVAGGWRNRVAALPPGRARRRELERLLTEEAAAVLRLPASRVSLDRPLRSLGLDSLLTLEFRNRLERATGLRVAAPVFFSHPTIAALTGFVAERWELELEAPSAETAPAEDAELTALLDELDQLSDEDVRALLEDRGAP
jgi:acyl transferase domain-containing protein